MSFESATQRMLEIRALADPRALPANTGQQSAVDGGPSFADALGAAQVQYGVLGAQPDSAASGLPVLPAGAEAGMLVGPGSGYAPTGIPPQPSPYAGYGGYGSYMSPYLQSGYGGVTPIQGALPPGMYQGSVGQRMVALAQGELGVRETSGTNEAPRIRQYREASGAEATPGPWCAYFVSWLAQQSGAPIGTGGQGTGYVPTLEAWGRSTGRFFSGGVPPQPGDIVIFDRGSGIADHTGIVERLDADGTLHTIEGNTSDMVARRTYAAGSSQVRGFVRPG